jgi:peptide/nickel transport system substrate-binding protein
MKPWQFVVFGVLLFALACIPSETERSAVPADTVVIGVVADLQSWNPYLAEDLFSEELLALIYPSLAVEQADYRLHPPSFAPSLAESWEFSDDGLELDFHLRADARWSDGVPVTADDVIFSWRIQTAPEIAWAWMDVKAFIDEVEKVDDYTVRFRFSHRYPYQLMDANDGLIVPAHIWREIPYERWFDTDWKELVVSAGPFVPGEHSPQQEIVLERNPTFFVADRPRLERVIFRIVPSKTGLLNQLFSGGIDLMNSVPPSEAERMRSDPEVELIMFADRSYTHICWNLDREPFADPRVRRAIGLAIDRGTIIDVAYNGFAQISVGPVLSSMWAFDQELAPLPFDPIAARELLAEAGWVDHDDDGVLDRDGRDFEFELMAPSENEVRQDVSLLIERDLAQVGIRVIPRFVEWGSMQEAMDKGTFDAFVNRWIEPTQVDLEEIWHSPPAGVSTLNFGRYANPEVDRLIEEAAEAPDFGIQKPLLDRIQQIIVADQPYTFLVENVRLVGVNSRVRGANINDATLFFNLEDWWIEP